jgi:CDP-glucose 4,6-dehydratase
VFEPLYGYLLLAKSLYGNGMPFSGAWNFGPRKANEKPVKWILERILKLWGGETSWHLDKGIHPHESHYLKLNSNKAKSKLGWQPKWNLDRSLRHTVVWYKSFYEKKDMFSITLKQIENYEDTLKT